MLSSAVTRVGFHVYVGSHLQALVNSHSSRAFAYIEAIGSHLQAFMFCSASEFFFNVCGGDQVDLEHVFVICNTVECKETNEPHSLI